MQWLSHLVFFLQMVHVSNCQLTGLFVTDCILFVSACHESCAESCTGSSPKDCEKCKEGWDMTEEDGCKGIFHTSICHSYRSALYNVLDQTKTGSDEQSQNHKSWGFFVKVKKVL